LQVFWLDYFDSGLSRSQGRRVPIHLATKAPSLEELQEAAVKLGYKPMPQPARWPQRPTRQSGYVQLPKKGAKGTMMMALAKSLAEVRSERRPQG